MSSSGKAAIEDAWEGGEEQHVRLKTGASLCGLEHDGSGNLSILNLTWHDSNYITGWVCNAVPTCGACCLLLLVDTEGVLEVCHANVGW
jgi:hypothetical protein